MSHVIPHVKKKIENYLIRIDVRFIKKLPLVIGKQVITKTDKINLCGHTQCRNLYCCTQPEFVI